MEATFFSRDSLQHLEVALLELFGKHSVSIHMDEDLKSERLPKLAEQSQKIPRHPFPGLAHKDLQVCIT